VECFYFFFTFSFSYYVVGWVFRCWGISFSVFCVFSSEPRRFLTGRGGGMLEVTDILIKWLDGVAYLAGLTLKGTDQERR